jgi:hypothetical protein
LRADGIAYRAASYICNGGVTAFGARIVSSFGYTPLQTILLLIPGGAATVVSSIWSERVGVRSRLITQAIDKLALLRMVGRKDA